MKEVVARDETIDDEIKRHKLKQTLRTGLKILSRRLSVRLWSLMADMPKPIKKHHCLLIKALTKPDKCKKRFVEFVDGKYNEYLADVVGKLQSRPVLARVGLLCDTV